MATTVPLKILVLGDPEVGKTSVIRRLTHGTFSPRYVASVGVEFHLCEVKFDGKSVHLQLWDVSEAASIPKVYFKDVFGALVIYDVTRPRTFDSVVKWKRILDDHAPSLPVILVGNKVDMEIAQTDEASLDQFCDDHGFVTWFDTSAKNGTHVNDTILRLVADIQTHKHAFTDKYHDHILIRPGPGHVPPSSSCSG